MNKWEEKRTRPVLPIYLAALVWPVGALLLPAYRLSNLLIIIGLSLAAYGLGTKFCPTRVIRKQVPYATGSEDVDAMLTEITAKLDELHELNDEIPDAQLSYEMDRMEKAGRSIVRVVERQPEKARQVDRFARYYLPEAVKILAAYARIEKDFADVGMDMGERTTYETVVQAGFKGENSQQILNEVRRNTTTIAKAFENQLDALYSAEAMDISTDIEVLDGILKSQNLT